ncbi:membrane proteins related to metalloendopeptidases [Geminocystis sp. NIES-3708]|uniref:DUF928 domain-containing protein n=1 Tax=Geminocystis sp. NIES-3708 TaxID=1615909 RepID=UPI0005FCA653|nr:DUF928 domain-containing protein [Geminocystis sp. NIES-3708]BAQ59647.1 membrane proteins related to metalloendopeptidases [Geminocystis sp. NIES-3708]
MLRSIISPSIICLTSISFLFPITSPVNANSLSFHKSSVKSFTIAQNTTTPRLRFRLPDRGIPGARQGGATRSTSPKIVPIIPSEKLALTATDSPTIFVYIAKNDSTKASLTITDENKKQLYQTEFTLPQQEGIFRIKLPANLKIEAQQPYRWELKLLSPENPSASLKLKTSGWVEKVSPPQNLVTKDKWENLNQLAEAGLWYDTLNELATLRLENPQNAEVETEWVELLKSVGLEYIAKNDIYSNVIILN